MLGEWMIIHGWHLVGSLPIQLLNLGQKAVWFWWNFIHWWKRRLFLWRPRHVTSGIHPESYSRVFKPGAILSQHSVSLSRFAIPISRTETTSFKCCTTFDYLLMHFFMLTSWCRGTFFYIKLMWYFQGPNCTNVMGENSSMSRPPKRLVVFSHAAEPKMSWKDFMIEIRVWHLLQPIAYVNKHIYTYIYIYSTCTYIDIYTYMRHVCVYNTLKP